MLHLEEIKKCLIHIGTLQYKKKKKMPRPHPNVLTITEVLYTPLDGVMILQMEYETKL